MQNIQKMQTLAGELSFRMDFEAIIKMEDKLGHQLVLETFNGLMNTDSRTFTKDVLEVLANCCVEKEIDGTGLKEILVPDYPTMLILDDISSKLVLGFFGSSEESGEEKKEIASQVNEKDS